MPSFNDDYVAQVWSQIYTVGSWKMVGSTLKTKKNS